MEVKLCVETELEKELAMKELGRNKEEANRIESGIEAKGEIPS